METVKKLTQSGRAVICSIHQPRDKTFKLFDKLLLLAKGEASFSVGLSCSISHHIITLPSLIRPNVLLWPNDNRTRLHVKHWLSVSTTREYCRFSARYHDYRYSDADAALGVATGGRQNL